MKKHITVAAAEALAAQGWEVVDIDRFPASVAIAYNHPDKAGRVTVWSDSYNNDGITYVNVDSVPDGYYDLNECRFYVE